MASNALGNSGGRLYSFGSAPVLIDCNFIVDSTNGNGRGIRSLKGQGVQNVFMHTTAAFTGTSHTSTSITAIASTASLLPGMPVQGSGIPVGTKIATIVSSTAITLTKATSSSTTGSITYQAVGSPNPAAGCALIQLSSNYNRYLGGFSGFVSPVTGSAINIDASDALLTVGQPYVITSVGAGPAGTVTIAPVADVAGSLASKYFTLYDSYGNVFVVWFSVSGVGVRPSLGTAAPQGVAGLHYVQQSIASGDTAATIGAALVLTIQNLPSGIQGTYSFTASGTTTVTVVSTVNSPVAGIPQDGTTTIPEQGPSVPIIFTVTSANATAAAIYTDGSGHLYTVSATIASGTSLSTTGVGTPIGATLTKVSGTGDATITFSAAVTGYATGFTFAQTVSDTNLQDWQGVGLPYGLTPTVGQSFIATTTGAGASTGQVKAVGVSGITSIEVIGDPNTSFAPMPQGGSANVGAWILVQFTAATSASVTTPIATAPAAGCTVGMSFYVDTKSSPSNVNSH